MINLQFKLSDEQQTFIESARRGQNLLVDACIGSGKTTAIQYLCSAMPSDVQILYLTYNKLLKLDAKDKIKSSNVTVTNYHGFAYLMLKNLNICAGVSDLIQKFLQVKPPLKHYDLLILDEYQDIEQELADMLEYIKSSNLSMQIVAVGDMQQKIYDKTTLNVPDFMQRFLGEYTKLNFTKCFRLSSDYAAKLGRIWGKEISGVNGSCVVSQMKVDKVVSFLAAQKPEDILCLGARIGDMADTLNKLEENYSEVFNKKTVYASISDDDSRSVTPDNKCAIFTTYDSSKGLERKICVIFDYTESYWQTRINKPQQSYEILRNIFCVAASRGKERIIFVGNGEDMLSEQTLTTKPKYGVPFNNVNISEMFDFKYKENVEECFSLLNVKPISNIKELSEIRIKNRDEMIDLSPCIGIYQEAAFFNNYDIEKSLELYFTLHPQEKILYSKQDQYSSLDKKILLLTSLETRQQRYRKQVNVPFVKRRERNALIKRLHTMFDCRENVQVQSDIQFFDNQKNEKLFTAIGLADVVKDDTVYELKFVSSVTHEHFLQCACYVVALGLPRGVLWNTRSNAKFEIQIPDRAKFLDAVVKTVTKGAYDKANNQAAFKGDGLTERATD